MLARTRWTDKKERNNYRQTAIDPSVASLVTTALLPSWSCFGYASIRNQAKRLRRFAVKPPPCTNYVTICGEFLEFCFKSMKLWLNCESKQLMWNSVDADGSRFVSFAQLSQLIFILLQTAESKLIPSYCSLSPSGCIKATANSCSLQPPTPKDEVSNIRSGARISDCN